MFWPRELRRAAARQQAVFYRPSVKWGIMTTVIACLLATAAKAEVRVFVEEANGLRVVQAP